MIRMIVCMGENREIGYQNDMPWGRGLPADLAYFKKMTNGKSVLMGRKTYESILASLGKNLPNRQSIVLTRNHEFQAKGVEVVSSFLEALSVSSDLWVIGGASLYDVCIDLADELYVTHILQPFMADTYFPFIDLEVWEQVANETGETNKENPYPYEYLVYRKRS